jgi:hypothetical protein
MSADPTYYYDIVFPSSFTGSYVVNIESDAIRTFTVTNKTPSGFRLDTNSITPITDVVYWDANDLSTGDFGAIMGFQGPTGDMIFGTAYGGITGFQGYQGPIGITGVGYQGFQGPAGSGTGDGVQGYQGLMGITGLDGFQGFQGFIGITGSNGLQGTQGTTGITGLDGFQGFQGFIGITGMNGTQGAQGNQGPGFTSILSPGTGRLLTSTGSSTTEAVAQTNLTFDGSLLTLTASNFQVTSGQSWTTLKPNGNTSTNVTIDLNAGNVQSYTLAANTTFTFSNGKSGGTYIIILTQGASSFTASFASAKWSGGISPVITSTTNAVDVFTFLYDGTNYYGSFLQNY